ncbi:hypothetical protein [Photobacterium galatheae]|uniref:Uncharacterized protein n=1 Tax=Photobacterium galatheae TaxID=1654360 RepID=A0A066RTY2_9GAMM|nr:hypothetical protein [Photobacterium galatheae]KDM90838.1 hypothetical protein EA58_13845 [Photobacterium galatheae]MCM0149194.1 hypothetical protein [Photobacterium galatheae]
MKYHDVVSIANETPHFLSVADDCSNLNPSDHKKIKAISGIICAADESHKPQVLAFLATTSFLSVSAMLKEALNEDVEATEKFFDSITNQDLDTAAGRVLSEKLRLYYALKIISNTFDDQNLLNLKKSFSNDE